MFFSIFINMDKKYYTVYKTTNLINNKFYIGIHATNNLNDEYLGSGFALKKAIKKYGKDNFQKEILFLFDNKTDMIQKEIELVNENLIKNTMSYNINMGGYGLITLEEEKRKKTILKIQQSMLNRSKEKKLCSIKKRKNTMLSNDPNIFKLIGIKSSETQLLNYKNGYINPNTNFTPINIYNQNGEITYTILRNELKELCEKEKLPFRVLIKSLQNHGEPILLNSPSRTNPEFNKYRFWYALYSNQKRGDFVEKLRQRGFIYNILDPNGVVVLKFMDFIKYYCKKNGLPIDSMRNSLKQGKPIKSGNFKGYQLIIKDQIIYPNN